MDLLEELHKTRTLHMKKATIKLGYPEEKEGQLKILVSGQTYKNRLCLYCGNPLKVDRFDSLLFKSSICERCHDIVGSIAFDSNGWNRGDA
jgi:hypothetical protein